MVDCTVMKIEWWKTVVEQEFKHVKIIHVNQHDESFEHIVQTHQSVRIMVQDRVSMLKESKTTAEKSLRAAHQIKYVPAAHVNLNEMWIVATAVINGDIFQISVEVKLCVNLDVIDQPIHVLYENVNE